MLCSGRWLVLWLPLAVRTWHVVSVKGACMLNLFSACSCEGRDPGWGIPGNCQVVVVERIQFA
jgi:hypothetical protein